MKLLRLLAIAFFGTLFSCSKKPVEVTGQIFVITQGRDNIKMGGVQVRVIPDEDFRKAVNEVLPWLEAEVQKEAQANTDADHMTALIREIVAMEEAAESPIPELPAIRKALVEESGSAKNLMESALAAPLYQQAVAKALNVVSSKQEFTTDADGRFAVKATGKTWFIAMSSRAVGEKSEQYLWVKGFEPAEGITTASLVISNESNIGSDDQFHALISGASGNAGGLEAHRATGKAGVSESIKTLVASKREAVNAAQANAVREVAEAKVKAERAATDPKVKAERAAAEAKAKEERGVKELLAKQAANQAGQEHDFEIAPGVTMTFCWCPAGGFIMGSPESEIGRSDNEYQVKASLTKGFWMAKTEVTQAQWQAVMGNNPSEFKGASRPVERVSWNDTQEFLVKLNARLGDADGGRMVLPTEAQWEYAARAIVLPTEAQWEYAARAAHAGFYAGGNLDEVAWHHGNSGNETHLVGTKKANAWGLYDMSGNVVEWCQDWYDWGRVGGADPSGPQAGEGRILRGGSWRSGWFGDGRVAGRYTLAPLGSYDNIGFRVARSSVLTGHVFVVTEDREEVRMGGVQVRVIPDDDFVKAVNEVLPWLEGEVQKEAQANTDSDQIVDLIREIVAIEEAAEKPIPELLQIRKALVDELESATNLLQSALAAPPLYQQATAKLLDVVSSKQEVTTGADGRFSIPATGKIWIIAAGSRAVGDEEESYFWIKGFEPAEGSAAASLVISNESDIGSDDQFHALISGAVGKAGGLEAHRTAGKAAVSEKMKTLVAAKRAEAEAAKLKASQEVAKIYKKFRGNQAGEQKVIEIAPGVIMTFCWCPAGDFVMGSPAPEEDRSEDEDQVKVSLSKGFWMANTEVTQAQWQALMGATPSHFKGANLPVEKVSWHDAQDFLKKLNARLGSEDGGTMALPTQAQWEYAARAGHNGAYPGDPLDQVAWYNDNSGGTTHDVGAKRANAWGLHAMSGNVWEWCADWYDEDLQGGVDPRGPALGSLRVWRGGSWSFGGASCCRVANRGGSSPPNAYDYAGFRVARSSAP